MTDWKERLKEILKLMCKLNPTRVEVIEVKDKLQQFWNDLQSNKFTNITPEEKINLTNWCKTFVTISEMVIEKTSTKYN